MGSQNIHARFLLYFQRVFYRSYFFNPANDVFQLIEFFRTQTCVTRYNTLFMGNKRLEIYRESSAIFQLNISHYAISNILVLFNKLTRLVFFSIFLKFICELLEVVEIVSS